VVVPLFLFGQVRAPVTSRAALFLLLQTFDDRKVQAQRVRLCGWLREVARKKERLCVLEIGAGASKSSMALETDALLQQFGDRATLVRVNPVGFAPDAGGPEEGDVTGGGGVRGRAETVLVRLGAEEALLRIGELVRERARGGAAG